MGTGSGFEFLAIKLIKQNRGLLTSKNRHKRLKELYVGQGNAKHDGKHIQLSKEQINEGRKRAKLYIKKRNRSTYIWIAMALIFSISAVSYIAYTLLG